VPARRKLGDIGLDIFGAAVSFGTPMARAILTQKHAQKRANGSQPEKHFL
jgi:hypothetical protein